MDGGIKKIVLWVEQVMQKINPPHRYRPEGDATFGPEEAHSLIPRIPHPVSQALGPTKPPPKPPPRKGVQGKGWLVGCWAWAMVGWPSTSGRPPSATAGGGPPLRGMMALELDGSMDRGKTYLKVYLLKISISLF